MWTCDFLNVNGTSFLLQFQDRFPGQPECCVFERPWEPPAPSFLDGVPIFKSSELKNRTVDWYQLNVSVSDGGPFGYGFFRDTQIPAGFYFGGLWNLSNGTILNSMVVQYYEEFSPKITVPGIFDVPKSCAKATACTNFGKRRK